MKGIQQNSVISKIKRSRFDDIVVSLYVSLLLGITMHSGCMTVSTILSFERMCRAPISPIHKIMFFTTYYGAQPSSVFQLSPPTKTNTSRNVVRSPQKQVVPIECT